jgi:hypothetical protein
MPEGAVILASRESFWTERREFAFVEGTMWCAGSEWRARRVARGGRRRECAEPGRNGVVGTSIGTKSQRVVLVARDVMALEKVSGARIERLPVTPGTTAFGVVLVDAVPTPNVIRLVRSAPSASTEFACDDFEGPIANTGPCR